ncbi:putative entry exclusion protein TrbK-alt [Alteraurantiacibacter palmitatis]|uniref:Entry exclusion protein TrbK-alt n=2 Tax=Alteraurantiacibacter palmitatis TaxID=2054628 RepID=A0ABV7E8I9_9SPHN
MSRVVKLAAAAAFGGLLVAVAVVSTTRPTAPPSAPILVPDEAPRPNAYSAELKRCRTITVPEAPCDAVWDAERTRFFHGRGRQP